MQGQFRGQNTYLATYYDANGNRRWIQHGDGTGPLFYTDFDNLNRPIKLHRWSDTLMFINYNSRGLVDTIDRALSEQMHQPVTSAG